MNIPRIPLQPLRLLLMQPQRLPPQPNPIIVLPIMVLIPSLPLGMHPSRLAENSQFPLQLL
jgi:hypothetical protein